MRCFEPDGKIRNMHFGQATAGNAFVRIEISTDEFGNMDERRTWEYIRLRLFCRLVPGGDLVIVNGPLKEVSDDVIGG